MLGPRYRKSVTDRTKFATLEQTFNLGVLARFRPDRYWGRNPQISRVLNLTSRPSTNLPLSPSSFLLTMPTGFRAML